MIPASLPPNRLPAKYCDTTAPMAKIAVGGRSANSVSPKAEELAAISQNKNGGFSNHGTPAGNIESARYAQAIRDYDTVYRLIPGSQTLHAEAMNCDDRSREREPHCDHGICTVQRPKLLMSRRLVPDLSFVGV